MRLLYPCDPFNKKRPEETFQEEFEAAQAAGLACSLFSSEDLDTGHFRPVPAFQAGEQVLYRGWMLGLDSYFRLFSEIESKGAALITSPHSYRLCHHLPNWYELCKEFTPETAFLKKDDDFTCVLAGLDWPAYFVKDYVKSLTTSRGSVARTAHEVAEIVALLEKYRGSIEGGVCVRRFEEFQPETEQRYFAQRGKVFACSEFIPSMVKEIASRISSPFFSIDMAMTRDGALRLIELGDGQVSDRKHWPADRFVKMLSSID